MMKNKLNQEIPDSMARNPSNWKGVLYFNRLDPRLVVQKQSARVGRTLNFANPLSYLTIEVLILIIATVTVIAG